MFRWGPAIFSDLQGPSKTHGSVSSTRLLSHSSNENVNITTNVYWSTMICVSHPTWREQFFPCVYSQKCHLACNCSMVSNETMSLLCVHMGVANFCHMSARQIMNIHTDINGSFAAQLHAAMQYNHRTCRFVASLTRLTGSWTNEIRYCKGSPMGFLREPCRIFMSICSYIDVYICIHIHIIIYMYI